MKKSTFILILLIFTCIFITQCSDVEQIDKTFELEFYDLNDNSVIQHVANGQLFFNEQKGRHEIISGDLIEVQSIHYETGEIVYGYVHKDSRYTETKVEINGRIKWEIKRGYYGYSGGCYYWGTLIIDDNGNELFVPDDSLYNMPICEEGIWA